MTLRSGKHAVVVLVALWVSGCSGSFDESVDTSAIALCDDGAPRDLGRETLAPNDGWAADGVGTTGGSLAPPEQVYTVTNRAEFIAALNNGVFSSTSPSTPSTAPKIIYVDGTIDFNVDDTNEPLACADYYRDGYTLDAFLAAYDPVVWGRVAPSGALETARVASQAAQQARVRMRVGSTRRSSGSARRRVCAASGSTFVVRAR